MIEVYLNCLEQLEAAIKMAVGADCYDYAMAKMAEMEEKSESSSDADLCENKFVIDMSSVRFKSVLLN